MSTIPSEHQEALALVGFMRKFGLKFIHVGNEIGIGGHAGWKVGSRKKTEGVSKGFPDYLIFFKGELVAVELKRQRKVLKNGKPSEAMSDIDPEQWQWHHFLNSLPYCHAYICFGANDAISVIKEHIGITQ